MDDLFDPIFPDDLARLHPLPCDQDTAFQEAGHIYAIRVNNSWTTEGLTSVTAWIGTYLGETDDKFKFIAMRKAKSLNEKFLCRSSDEYPTELYDMIDKEDWDGSVHVTHRICTTAEAFAHRIVSDKKFIRLPYTKDSDSELELKVKEWRELTEPSLDEYIRIFSSDPYDMRMLAVLPHLTGHDVRELWPRFGTRLHYDIEHHLNGHPPKHTLNFPEWKQVLKFMEYLKSKGEVPFRTELTMSIPALRLCGQADFISRKPDGKFVLYDWKRTASIEVDSKEMMLPPWSHRTCSSKNKYSIQLNMYRQMLKTYGIEVEEMYLVCFHTNYGQTYKLVPIRCIMGQGDSLDAKALRQMVRDRKRQVDERVYT
jgi:hypothetical protein